MAKPSHGDQKRRRTTRVPTRKLPYTQALCFLHCASLQKGLCSFGYGRFLCLAQYQIYFGLIYYNLRAGALVSEHLRITVCKDLNSFYNIFIIFRWIKVYSRFFFRDQIQIPGTLKIIFLRARRILIRQDLK